jgi:hypothetical protein
MRIEQRARSDARSPRVACRLGVFEKHLATLNEAAGAAAATVDRARS